MPKFMDLELYGSVLHCPHCGEETGDGPWKTVLFGWHRMDCEYRRFLVRNWVDAGMGFLV